jgi:hypothetical protein
MGFYQTTPFKPTPTLLVQGRPEYVFGSLNDKTGPTLGNVISDAAATTTATLIFQIVSGNIPAVDSQITVVGTANSAGVFNVTNATVLSVSCTDGGVCTVTYAIASTTQVKTADGGQVIIPQPEVGDALTTTSASVPVACPDSPSQQSGKSLSVTLKLPASTTANPSTLSGVTVVIEGSNIDRDAAYNAIGTIVTGASAGNTYDWQSGQGDTATGTLAAGSVILPNFRFYRLHATAVTGAGPIVGSIMM